MTTIAFRSDTVTLPTDEMREEVGAIEKRIAATHRDAAVQPDCFGQLRRTACGRKNRGGDRRLRGSSPTAARWLPARWFCRSRYHRRKTSPAGPTKAGRDSELTARNTARCSSFPPGLASKPLRQYIADFAWFHYREAMGEEQPSCPFVFFPFTLCAALNGTFRIAFKGALQPATLSMGIVTCRSISSGARPGNAVTIDTFCGEISG